jgi:hypothetical protein
MATLETMRAEDLRRWRSEFPEATAIADLRPRHRQTCVGVAAKIRVVPGRALEVTIEDGSGRLTAIWSGRNNLPGLELGSGLRLTGTVAIDDEGARRILNPAWTLVAEPYA